MKKLLLILCISCFYLHLEAQTESAAKSPINSYNKYLIKLDSNVAYNITAISNLLKQVCAATSADYNSTTKYFQVLTTRLLEKNIINGKLQKNATPMTEFILVGKIEVSESQELNTINAQ